MSFDGDEPLAPLDWQHNLIVLPHLRLDAQSFAHELRWAQRPFVHLGLPDGFGLDRHDFFPQGTPRTYSSKAALLGRCSARPRDFGVRTIGTLSGNTSR
jgi:hypothetical protein